MKSTEQIAADCGLDDDEEKILCDAVNGKVKIRETDPEAMVLKLYRRIEKLEGSLEEVKAAHDRVSSIMEDGDHGGNEELRDAVVGLCESLNYLYEQQGGK